MELNLVLIYFTFISSYIITSILCFINDIKKPVFKLVNDKIQINNRRELIYLYKKALLIVSKNIFFKGKFNFEIFDRNRFYRKFLVSKKNQKDIDQVNFGLIYNLTKFDAKIFFISLNKDKLEMSDDLDNLIYSFNNKSVTINNWISLRSFVNKILSSYPG